jgi:mycoredoxin
MPLAFVACGAAIVANQVRDGSVPAAVVLGSLFLALAVAFSPLSFPRHVSAAAAQAAGRPVVYWRPGCQYCMRLRLRLFGRARHASWVNIWRDTEGAAAVRAVAGGNETVPTVVLPGGEARVNPDPAWVRTQLAAAAGPGGR